MSISALAALNVRGRAGLPREHLKWPIIANGILATLVVAIAWLAAAVGRAEYPNADATFLLLTSFIIAGSFAIVFWFAWQLRAVDWIEHVDGNSSIS